MLLEGVPGAGPDTTDFSVDTPDAPELVVVKLLLMTMLGMLGAEGPGVATAGQ